MRLTPPKSAKSMSSIAAVDAAAEDEDQDYLPLNNVVDWDEWNRTGTNVAATAAAKKRTKKVARPPHDKAEPRLRPKQARKNPAANGREAKLAAKGGGAKQQQQQQLAAAKKTITEKKE